METSTVAVLVGIIAYVSGLAWSYMMATRVVPPRVERRFHEFYNDPERVDEMFGVVWDRSGDVFKDKIIASLNGSALRDIRTLQSNLPDVQTGVQSAVIDEMVSRLPAEVPPGDVLKALKMFSKKPGFVDQIGGLMETLTFLQSMGWAGPSAEPGNGGGGSFPQPPQSLGGFHPLAK